MLEKSILLCGGKGSRMMPSTGIHNKHLLPVYSNNNGSVPMIIYPLNTLIRSGAKKILIVSSQEHAGDIIDFLGDGKKFGVDFTYKIQDHNDPKRPVGIASALNLAKDFVGPDKFSVHLGDNFYEEEFSYDFTNFIRGNNQAHVFLKEVYDPERFGVAVVENNKIIDIEEKPKKPKSKLAVTGLYLYTPHVFSIIDTLKPSDRGELEVSDINLFYAKNNEMTFTKLRGYWRDMGTPASMRETIEHINKFDFRHKFHKDLQ
jgi:glucose-1-phosphate thymidylyltransferase